MTGAYGTRAEHLAWCKERALEYVDADPHMAFTSLASDLLKHPGTRGHDALGLGSGLLLAGQLNTPAAMRQFIEGCN